MLNPKRKLFRWGPISGCPFFMHFTVFTSFAPMKKLFGICYPETYVIYEDKKVTWLLDEEDFVKHSRQFVESIILSPEDQTNYFKFWEQKTKSLTDAVAKLTNQDFSSLSDKELAHSFQKLSIAYSNWWAVTMTVELVTTSVEPMLGEKLKVYYPQEHPKEYNEAFSILTAPRILTFYRQEQKDLLGILASSKGEKDKKLKEHQKKYYWIYNSYLLTKVLDVNYFKKELGKLEKSDWKNILREIENYTLTIDRNKQRILESINPSREVLDLISVAEKFSALQDTRKMHNFQVEHYLELFVDEFSKRTKIKPEKLKLLLPEEFENSLSKVDGHMLDLREKCFISHLTENSVEYLEGTNTTGVVNQLNGATNLEQSVIHGTLASTGESYYFRGTAKIVLTINEINKIEKGDVLITTMTSPDFVIGMKKAGAIVTDTGGILSHAAIVARELKKPCIVGTEIATKVIKDGDVVELHCGRGTIKIIKHSSN